MCPHLNKIKKYKQYIQIIQRSMYNVYQFMNKKDREESQSKKAKEREERANRHQEYKKMAHENLKKKCDDFLEKQLSAQKPFVLEDDHFQRWRNHRPFRDIEVQQKFKGDKVFKHRPNSDMDKYYTERERRQQRQLAAKNQDLVKSGIIPKEHLSRSVLSQGPYNPKIAFRDIKKDEEYLQPKLRYSNVTDLQGMSESEMLFDERLNSIYDKYEQKRLKIGKLSRMNSFQQLDSSVGAQSVILKSTRSVSFKDSTKKSILQPQLSQLSYNSKSSKKNKTYFKLAKQMEMFHPLPERREELSELLKRSQFTRKKDMTNIRSNSYHENFEKHPIL